MLYLEVMRKTSGTCLFLLREDLPTCTDDEVEHAFEEFYEDVHTEFLKFGEIVNFKVCRNGSSHLRGNMYVHYKSEDSAVLAYQSVNGRYFAGKQVQCEFVGVTRWKVAICGEFMKSKFKTCSRGMTCNFIHCFRNPGGDYEWADWDKPPPRYWLEKMAALFGHSDDSGCDKLMDSVSPRSRRSSSRIPQEHADRYHSRRSQSRETDHSRSSKRYSDYDLLSTAHPRHHRSADQKRPEDLDEKHYDNRPSSKERPSSRKASVDCDSERTLWDRDGVRSGHSDCSRRHSRTHKNGKLESEGGGADMRINVSESERYPKRNIRHRDKRSALADAGDGVSSNGNCLDVDKNAARSPNEDLRFTDGRWDDRRSVCHNLSGDWSDEEIGTTRYTQKSERSDVCRGHREVEHDYGKPSNSSRSYKSSESSSRYHSRKDDGRPGSAESKREYPDDSKKSKRKRETDKSYDSERKSKHHDRKSSRAPDVDEDMDKRGRWEQNTLNKN